MLKSNMFKPKGFLLSILLMLMLGTVSFSQVLVLMHDTTITTSQAKRLADKDSLLKYLPSVLSSGYTLNTFDTNSTFSGLNNYCTIIVQETSFDAATCRYLGLAARNQLTAWLNSGTPANKRTLIIIGGDEGYNYDRTGSPGRDTNFSRGVGGFIYLVDNGNLTSQNGIYKIAGSVKDSITTSPAGGSFYPDDLRLTNSSTALYGFSGRGGTDSLSALARVTANYNVITLTIDPRYFTNNGGSAPNPNKGLQRVLSDLVQYAVSNGGCQGPPPTVPNYIYYKFEGNPSPTNLFNCAVPGVGTSAPTYTGVTLTSGGQFDSCITGSGVTGAGVNTGWNLNFGSSSWTISMWLDATTTTFGYIFGDAGAGTFRCFNNGAAGTNAITLRGTGITNVNVTGFNSGPVVVHFVYDSALANIKVYKDGVLFSTVNQTPLNIAMGNGFKVGGYSTVAGFTGKLDEFRIYRRALSAGEVAASWNSNIPCGNITGVSGNNTQTPQDYRLDQNYPNPFNPSTSIRFALPKSSNVKLVIFDILGREVKTLVNEYRTTGNYVIDFDASALASGVYFYRLEAGSFVETKKMLLVK